MTVDMQCVTYRFDQRDAEALVLGKREERGRNAVIRDELLDRDGAREGDRVLETEPANVATDAIEVAAGHRGRTDEIKMGRPIGLSIFGEGRDDIVHGLVREDLAHREDRGALVGERAGDLRIRRTVEVLPVHECWDDSRIRKAGGLELLAVVLAVSDAELGGLSELLQLLAPQLRKRLQVVVETREIVTGRDVVVDDRLSRGRCEDLRHRVRAYRMVDEKEPVMTLDELEVVPRSRERAHLRFCFSREEIAPHAG